MVSHVWVTDGSCGNSSELVVFVSLLVGVVVHDTSAFRLSDTVFATCSVSTGNMVVNTI